ncbi:hypothetical protein [Shouchella patagoniensis]|uniref:hypothetical protein n=1 Tax=Shouchella patagoniensis TaxID=228576 RepID=UPI000995C5E4|nr:hypothetical protein [Shouchella patagoniensis]
MDELIKLLNKIEDKNKEVSIHHLIYLQEEGIIVKEEKELLCIISDNDTCVHLSSGLVEAGPSTLF